MSKKLSFKGTVGMGEQEIIRLKTNNGKTGYKITKFQIITTQPGAAGKSAEVIAQVFKTDQIGLITDVIDFTNSDLMAVSFLGIESNGWNNDAIIIFDNEITNQNMFITMTDSSGATVPTNYYLELETMALNDLQATQLTLKNIRQVLS